MNSNSVDDGGARAINSIFEIKDFTRLQLQDLESDCCINSQVQREKAIRSRLLSYGSGFSGLAIGLVGFLHRRQNLSIVAPMGVGVLMGSTSVLFAVASTIQQSRAERYKAIEISARKYMENPKEDVLMTLSHIRDLSYEQTKLGPLRHETYELDILRRMS